MFVTGWLAAAWLVAGAGRGPAAEHPHAAEPFALGPGGRDAAHYTADRPADLRHMAWSSTMTEPDMMDRRMEAEVTWTLEPRGRALEKLRLNAEGLSILEVTALDPAISLAHTHEAGLLTIELPRPLKLGREFKVRIRYEARDAKRGLHHILPSPMRPHRPMMVYTMSEPLEARHWVPCHDWPNERWTTEFRLTVPREYRAVANGVLMERRESAERTVTWHWRNRHPIDPHVMGFAVGRLVKLVDRAGDLPVHAYTQPGREAVARHSFRRVPRQIAFFERRLGVPFPFPAYSHVTVVDHHHGGMEHAGFSFIDPKLLSAGLDGAWDTERVEHWIISHMLAHQWFGGLVNYRSVSQAWLNEGFASYLDMLWQSHRDGRDRGMWRLWRLARRVAPFDRLESAQPLVTRRWTRPGAIYTMGAGRIYFKGAWVLHMLEQELGEDLFWQGVESYLRRHAWGSVETVDLRQALEAASGRDLEQFFAQWVFRGGLPELEVHAGWDDSERHLTLRVVQAQPVSLERPAFRFPLEFHVQAGSESLRFREWVEQTEHEYSYSLETAPQMVCVDPEGKVLKSLTVHRPAAWMVSQALEGPTAWAQLEAVEALAEQEHPDVLERVVQEGTRFQGVRVEAARTLGRMGSEAAVAALLRLERAGVEDVRVLAGVLDGLAEVISHPGVVDILTRHAGTPGPRPVRRAAVLALGRVEGEIAEPVVEALRRSLEPATRRQVRQAALQSVSRLEDPRLFEAVLAMTLPDRGEVLYDQAMRVLGELGQAEAHREVYRKVLLSWLARTDHNRQIAALAGLKALKDPETLPAVKKMTDQAETPALREMAREVAGIIREASVRDEEAEGRETKVGLP